MDDITGDINIIGFSLTGFGDATSFGRLLQERLQGRGYKGCVREISYGGLAINALAGLIDSATRAARPADWMALELATSFFSLHRYSYDDALPLVFHLVRFLVDRGHRKIFFLNLYRRDLDDEDCVVQAIRTVSRYFGVPILDLKKPFRDAAPGSSDGTTDGIHPDLGSRARIATAIEQFLDENASLTVRNRDGRGPSYRLLEVCALPHERERFHYAGRGKEMSALVLPAGERLSIDLGADEFVTGYCFLYGPETGYAMLSLDGREGLELITFDEHSYYRRIGFRPVQQRGRRAEVVALQKTRDVALVRATALKAESRREFVCGLVLMDETHSLPADLGAA